jgi:hypothetical protein
VSAGRHGRRALRRAGLLDSLGGKQAILRIQAGTPAAANAGHYARIVADHALLRRLVTGGCEIAELGYQVPDDVTAGPMLRVPADMWVTMQPPSGRCGRVVEGNPVGEPVARRVSRSSQGVRAGQARLCAGRPSG